ncbi:MAG: hypothetical protein IJV93_01905 [Lentisphaeria bacterium]|nr:hypothetical protein [Lentisphaeria bacterium]
MLISHVKRGQLIFLATFAAMIVCGTALLSLPFVTAEGNFPLINSFFMAVSAVCVTGLATNEICEFSFAGQLILLILVQLGAIGIMTLSASILLSLGRGLSFSNTLMLSNLNDNFTLRGTEGLTKIVVRYALVCEGVGAVLIYIGLMFNDPTGPGFGVSELLLPERYLTNAWYALFLSVNGFCNAGFSPIPGSLWKTNELVQLTMAVLVILGGLGIYVIYDLLEWFNKRRYSLRLHSKVVLSTSAILLAAGTFLVMVLSLDHGTPLSFFDAFCLSAFSRTAGFSTLQGTAFLSPGVALVVMVLMLLGGAPGSTAGGMKVTTAAVAFAAFRNTLKGNHEVLIFKRSVGMEVVLRAFTMMIIFLMLFFAGGTILHMINPSDIPLLDSMFEAASAITTTGLSMGVTGKLNADGKLFVILLMIIGRLGPFTILLFLLGREKPGQLKYPTERIIIG